MISFKLYSVTKMSYMNSLFVLKDRNEARSTDTKRDPLMNLQGPILGEGSNLLWTAFLRISYQMNLDTWLQIIFLSWKSLHANAKLFALLRHPSQPCATEGGKQAQTSQQELCTAEGSNYFRRIHSERSRMTHLWCYAAKKWRLNDFISEENCWYTQLPEF